MRLGLVRFADAKSVAKKIETLKYPAKKVVEPNQEKKMMKKRENNIYNVVTERQIQRAIEEGRIRRRAAQLEEAVTKSARDLWEMDAKQILHEIREHRNKFRRVSYKWLLQYLAKVKTKEEAEDVIACVKDFQVSGFELTEKVAAVLVRIAVTTGSDAALQIICDPKFRIFPKKETFLKLLTHYAHLGDVNAVKVIWQTALDKGVVPDQDWYLCYFRAFANSGTEGVWTVADLALKQGLEDVNMLNVLLKIAVKERRNERVEQVCSRLKGGNAATRSLLASFYLPSDPQRAAEALGSDRAAIDKFRSTCVADTALKALAPPFFEKIGAKFE